MHPSFTCKKVFLQSAASVGCYTIKVLYVQSVPGRFFSEFQKKNAKRQQKPTKNPILPRPDVQFVSVTGSNIWDTCAHLELDFRAVRRLRSKCDVMNMYTVVRTRWEARQAKQFGCCYVEGICQTHRTSGEPANVPKPKAKKKSSKKSLSRQSQLL